MSNVQKVSFSVRDNRGSDPAILAYYELENALDAVDVVGGNVSDAAWRNLDFAEMAFANTAPTSFEGAKRKIEMNDRWLSVIEGADGGSEGHLALVTRNSETLAEGMSCLHC